LAFVNKAPTFVSIGIFFKFSGTEVHGLTVKER